MEINLLGYTRLFHVEFLILTFLTSQSLASFGSSPNSNPLLSQTPVIGAHPVRRRATNMTLIACQGDCASLPATCYTCQTSDNCTYGEAVSFNCTVLDGATCSGNRRMEKVFQCRYCFLTVPNDEHTCFQNNTTCKVTATPRQRVKASCTTKDHVFCLGNRNFTKLVPCNWTSGYSWTAAFVLSITLGGFGVDRFYLGYWREGLGKFFSFGGLGVWTLIDVVLIATGYLGPSDGSLYVR